MGITKAEIARELGVTPTRIGQLVKSGMPALEDGTLDRDSTLKWISRYTSSSRGGWHFRGKRSIATRANELLGSKHVTPSGVVTVDGAPASQQSADDLIAELRVNTLCQFARWCLDCGMSPRDTFMATNVHLLAVLMAFDGADFFEKDPSDDEWRELLGDVDVDALYVEWDTLMKPHESGDPLHKNEST